jgi:uncharacterized protein YneF (UPF0154 family)
MIRIIIVVYAVLLAGVTIGVFVAMRRRGFNNVVNGKFEKRLK